MGVSKPLSGGTILGVHCVSPLPPGGYRESFGPLSECILPSGSTPKSQAQKPPLWSASQG